MEKLLSQAEAVDFLGVNDMTLRKWVREGKVPAYKISTRALRYRPEELRSFLERHRVEPQGPRVKPPKATPPAKPPKARKPAKKKRKPKGAAAKAPALRSLPGGVGGGAA